MNEIWYTVSQAAELLQLHEKTIQRFIREGKINAAKVGRSYRINGHELSTFAGTEDEKPEITDLFSIKSTELKDHPAVSAVIDCWIGGKEEAIRISNTLNAVMNSKTPEDGQGRFDFVFFETENKGKIIFYGEPLLVSKLLKIADQLLKKEAE